MSVVTSGHPSFSALAAFALGKLDAPAAETVHNHLAGCPDCRTVVETTPSDTLMGLLKRAAAKPGDTPSLAKSILKGTLALSNPEFDVASLPAELRDHPRYRILRKLGEGGMGAVYQAEHRMMERVVAIKVISSSLVDSPAAIERFEREVRAAAKLEHPNIVRAYDADQAGGAMLLAMEFVKGRTLAEVVAAKGPLPIAYACQCVRQAALGLQHAADHQMVHRDIKPQNLMLTEKGVVKILDFGLAKLVSERLSRAGLTGKDMVMGTPEYMAPEQARDTASADVRADVYALGCTLFYLLTGRPPFTGGTALEIVTKQVIDAPPSVTELRPEVPAELEVLIGRMLAKDPAGRPQTPREVAEALKAFTKAGGQSVVGFPTVKTATTSGTTVAHGRRWVIPAAVTGGAMLITFGLWAGGVFTAKTKCGTIVLKNVPADADVTLDDEKVTIMTGDGNTVEISVAPGKKHRLKVSKDGFSTFGEEVEIAAGDRTPITVTLDPELKQRPGGLVDPQLVMQPNPGPLAPGDKPAPKPAASVASEDRPASGPVPVPQGKKENGPPAVVLAPDKSEWAGTGTLQANGRQTPLVAALTITERSGTAFKALVRISAVNAATATKLDIEGTVTETGAVVLKVTRARSAPNLQENVSGSGKAEQSLIKIVLNNPDSGGTRSFVLKRLPERVAEFRFDGRWKCAYPNAKPFERSVSANGTWTNTTNNNPGKWNQDGGLLEVVLRSGAREWFVIDPDNLDELNGVGAKGKAKWTRQ
jgi:hypothetical protein